MGSAALHSGTDEATPAAQESRPTPLAAALREELAGKDAARSTLLGSEMAADFADLPGTELDALFTAAGILDLGWRGKAVVRGRDRVRWLNNLATHAIQQLPQGEGSYSFFLNSQGRIQGDAYIYRHEEDFYLDTALSQIPALLSHCKRYIIMDKVEMEDVSERWTALGVAGPKAAEVLASAKLPVPAETASGNASLVAAEFVGAEAVVIRAYGVRVPHYEVWISPAKVTSAWKVLAEAGAVRVGLEAAEALRVIEGIPLYGIDLGDRDLAQETGQMRALHFGKGCYLGQEIVERVRSRGKVHRQFAQFTLQGKLPALPAELTREGQTAGRITSAIEAAGSGMHGIFGLGIVREEALAGGAPLEYAGGAALPQPPPPYSA